jgi:hypothetical protein
MNPRTDWTETPAPGEPELLERLAKELGELQLAKGGKERTLHAKSHGGVRATLTVRDDLPAHAKQGLFAKGGTYQAYLRFSNGSAQREDDRKPDLRGLALKVLNVPGKKVLFEHPTQDFLFVDAAKLPFASPEEFVTFIKAAQKPATLPFVLLGKLGFRTFGLLAALAKTVKGGPPSLLDLAYHTVGAVAFGPYAARLHLVPVHPKTTEPKGTGPKYLADEVARRVKAGGIAFELTAQFHEGPGESIEDATTTWASAPVTLGRLELVTQDLASESGKKLQTYLEEASFDPWHALVEHRPLGISMRARKPSYFVSVTNRKAAKEPDGSEWASFG